MRDVIFRGKRVDTGEWVCGSFIPDLREVYNGDTDVFGYIKPFGRTKEERMMVEVDRETVGQYAGRKDKNGIKIFEGDIVYAPFWMPNGNGKGVISFYGSSFRIVWEDANHYDDLLSYIGEIEVIGNIHDSQEPLEKK